jgi:predicted TIM-barrel fold metal-dependent hydrolase
MKIDSHVHISIFENNAQNLEEAYVLLLKDMENNKVDFAIIIPDNIENLPNVADLDKAISLIKGNKKLFLLGSPQIIQRGSSEVAKYKELIKEGVVKGIKFFPGHDPYYPTDERCRPYYELCQNLDIPVLFHTGKNPGDDKCAEWNDPKYIVEVAKNYPDLKIIIAHYFWPKMDYCYEITKKVSNIYFDIAAMADDEVVEKSGGIEKIRSILKKTIEDGEDKIIFGTDWPICKIESHIDLIKSLGFGKDIEDKIFYKNAVKLYKLPI